MEYKGYVGVVDVDDEANILHGQIVNTRDVITFQGRNVKELRTALRDSVEDYLEFCKERGEEPERPFSGKFMVRVEPSLHRDLTIAAAKEGKSVQTVVREALQQRVFRGECESGGRTVRYTVNPPGDEFESASPSRKLPTVREQTRPALGTSARMSDLQVKRALPAAAKRK